MADDWLSTSDLPLETVQTIAELVEQMNRLYTRAGEPSLRVLGQDGSAEANEALAQRSKISRILDGLEDPSLPDVVAFLAVCQVVTEEQIRWRDAWRRASGQPASTADIELAIWALRQQAEELRDRTATELLAARRRCAERLRSLGAELAELRHRPVVGEPMEARAERMLELALQLQEIIDDAHREVLAVSALVEGLAPGAPLPEVSAQDVDDHNVSLVSTVLQHVPPAIAVRLLLVMDIATITSFAIKRPAIMGTLLSTLPSEEAGRWLPNWPADALVSVLSTMDTGAAARCLERMDGVAALAILTEMGRDVAAEVLVALPRETASRRLSEMDRMVAVQMLQLLDPEDAAGHLLQMEELNLARPREFLPHMSRELARKCLRLMDQRRSERKQAADLLRQVEKNTKAKG
jgi:flagellar motility protein MotE (MotC chaperone)